MKYVERRNEEFQVIIQPSNDLSEPHWNAIVVGYTVTGGPSPELALEAAREAVAMCLVEDIADRHAVRHKSYTDEELQEERARWTRLWREGRTKLRKGGCSAHRFTAKVRVRVSIS